MIFTVGCLTILFNCVSGQSANEQDVLDAFTDVYDIMYGIRDDQAKQIQELVDKDLKKTEEIKFLKVQIEELQKKQGPKGKEGPEGERGAQGEPQGPTDLWFVACEAIQVTGDTSSDVFSEGGLYLPTDKRASDAPNNPVWRNSLGNRFIFNTLSTDGWKIGSEDGLTTGNYWCKSKHIFIIFAIAIINSEYLCA